MRRFIRKNFLTLIAPVLFAIGLVMAMGILLFSQLTIHATKEVLQENHIVLNSLNALIEDELKEVESLAKILSTSTAVIGRLKQEQSGDVLDQELDRFSNSYVGDIFYVMDLEGNTIASSNRHLKDSFVGKSYKFRPYFQNAVKGQPSFYFALGSTSKKRGFYASDSVYDENGVIIGVAVVKRNLDNLEVFLVRNHHVFLYDDNGVIFLSSFPELLFKSVYPLSDNEKNIIQESHQYGGRVIQPLFMKKPVDGGDVDIYGKKMIYSVESIGNRGWNLVVLGSRDNIFLYQLTGGLMTVAFILLVLTIFIFVFLGRWGLEKAEKERDRAKLFFEFTPSGIFTVDQNQNVTSWNKKAQEITGYPADEIIGKKCTLFAKEPCVEYGCGLFDSESKKPIIGKECTIKRRDGQVRIIMKNADVLRDVEGNEIGGIESFEDITELKKIEGDLHASEERYALAMDAIEEGIWDYFPQIEELYLSPTWFMMLGYVPNELPMSYQTWQQLLHPQDLPMAEQAVVNLLEGKTDDFHIEVRMRHKDGSWRWILSRAKIVERDGSGLVKRMVGTHGDITNRKQAEVDREQAMEVKSKFTSTVSHELRTPLGPIKEGVAIILDGVVGDVNDQQRELLETVKRNAERLNRLINDVLDYQKLESGIMKFRIEENNINDVANEVKNSMSLVSRQKDIVLNLDLQDNIPMVSFDRDKISQVLVNLVNNAIKFTEQGSVTIKTRVEGNVLHASVADTGPGIREEDIQKLFQSFQQLETAHGRKTGGTGLGLAISKEIIIRHGGKIWAESKYGEGSEFHFVIPLAERRKR